MAVGWPRVLSIGGLTKPQLLDRLDQHGVLMNDYARALFDDPEFTTAPVASTVHIARVSLVELGLDDGGTYRQIMAAAASLGLAPCPMELGPHLRLDYLDQPEGPYLTVATKEPPDDPTVPNGFYLRRLDGQLWLRGYESGPENVYAPDFSEFVFVSG